MPIPIQKRSWSCFILDMFDHSSKFCPDWWLYFDFNTFRENDSVNNIFRINNNGKLDPTYLRINGVEIPIHTIICAVESILTLVVSPKPGIHDDAIHLPLVASLAKWSTALTHGYPTMTTVMYWVRDDRKGRDHLNFPEYLEGSEKPIAEESGALQDAGSCTVTRGRRRFFGGKLEESHDKQGSVCTGND